MKAACSPSAGGEARGEDRVDMTNRSREDILVIILFSAVGLFIPAVVVARHFFGLDPLSMLHITRGRTIAGTVLTVLAAGTCLLNFYLTLLVPWLYERRRGNMEDFAHVSGLPVIGGFFLFCAGTLMPPSVPLGIGLLLLYLADGNGLAWFLILLVRKGV